MKRRRFRHPFFCCTLLSALFQILVLAAFPQRIEAQTLSSEPSLILRGTIHAEDNQTYRLIPFQVPHGVARITVQFEYSGREERTVLDLGLFDPNGFRGWSGGSKAIFTVSNSDATPSYLAGPIVPGEWKLVVAVPNIRARNTSDFIAKIYFSTSGRVADEPSLLMPLLRKEPAWYRGDLHSHTAHSDASCQSQSNQKVPCPLFLTVDAAARRRLDFLAITDHNTISHFSEMRELQPYFDHLLLIPGREITTFHGHANLYGTVDFLDFRVGSDFVPNINALLKNIQASDVLLSINHPARTTGEDCMGCGWHPVSDLDWNLVHVIEAVNGDDADTQVSGIPFWQNRLNLGTRIIAIGGGDNHNALADLPGPGSIGYPTTVVHATQLSTPAILEAIRAGHVFIDVTGTSDRLLEFTAESKTIHATMGEILKLPAGETASFHIHFSHATAGHAEVILDGELASLLPTSEINQPDQHLSFTWPSDGKRHWIRINLRGPDGKLWLVGNPIFINFE